MILRAGGHANDDRFHVAADVNPVFAAQARSGQAVERRANRHGHGGGAADPRARGSLGIGGQREAAGRAEKPHQMRQQRQLVAPRAGTAHRATRTFPCACVSRETRAQMRRDFLGRGRSMTHDA